MEFLWVGNHPGIDLCNTVPVIDGEPVELLAAPDDLRRWLAAAHPAPRPEEPRPTRATLEWARRLREALRAVLTAKVDRHDELDALNSVLRELSAVPSVDELGNLEMRSANPQEQIRLRVASLAIHACSLPPGRVRRCANPRCVLLFHDVSKNGSRRWHDMASCGNQAKAAAHHSRQRAAEKTNQHRTSRR